ncbi:MAG: MotA/TolQ/ExbB proton channel family protein [Phycisphaerae bacterium]
MQISIIHLALALFGQVPVEPSGAATTMTSAGLHSVWDMVVKGGWMMLPIGLFSLIALTVVMERLFSLRRRVVIPPPFLPGLTKALGGEDGDRAEALSYCRADGSPIANILEAAIKKLGEPLDRLEKHVQEAGERVVLRLRKYLRVLAVVASIAPLMGLLGTIFGMIIAFETVATSGEALGKAELLAKGIYQAMITTAAGLLLAIPALLAYHWFSAKIEGLVSEMDRVAVEFIEEYGNAPRFNGRLAPPLRSTAADTETEPDEDDSVAAVASA